MIFLESITYHSHDKGRLCHALIGEEFMMGPTAAGLCLILLWWLLLSVPLSLLTRKLLNRNAERQLMSVCPLLGGGHGCGIDSSLHLTGPGSLTWF